MSTCKISPLLCVSLSVERRFYVYLLTNPRHTVLYVGVTGDLIRRVYQHRIHAVPGFTDRYNVTELVYYETYTNAIDAIAREKQLKAGSRRRKEALIEATNPEWQDLWSLLVES